MFGCFLGDTFCGTDGWRLWERFCWYSWGWGLNSALWSRVFLGLWLGRWIALLCTSIRDFTPLRFVVIPSTHEAPTLRPPPRPPFFVSFSTFCFTCPASRKFAYLSESSACARRHLGLRHLPPSKLAHIARLQVRALFAHSLQGSPASQRRWLM